MNSLLRYGLDSTIRLDLPEDVLVANCDAPRGRPVEDVRAAATAALAEPLDFPPLAQAVVPGDRVAIAVDQDAPQAELIVQAVIDELLGAGIEPRDISVVRSATGPVADASPPAGGAVEPGGDGPAYTVHDPADRERLCYLGASAEAKPIYMDRAIFEADFVIPIGCLRLDGSWGYHGVSGGVFPAFSDAKSLARYRSPAAADSAVQQKRLRREADEVSWLLGITFTIQVVPGAGEDVLHVLAGDVHSVLERGRKLCAEAWEYTVPSRASLVVASIEGDAAQQTWENVARALAAGRRAVAEDGAIAICTDLAASPGPGVQRLAGADDLQEALREIVKYRPSDALPASQLLHALEHNKVYLLSRLDEAVVEELGIAPVSSGEQIARLTSHHPSCILLANAQHALVTSAEDL